MKTAIVTGATSYLGIELAARLENEGVDVHAIQRPGSNISRLKARAPSTTVHIYDPSQKSLSDIFSTAQPDFIFHLAGKYIREEKPDDIEMLVDANITFGSQLLQAAQNSNVKGFINTGSYFQFSNEGEPPVNFYAATKNAFAEILKYHQSWNNFAVASLIIFDTFGPEDWRPKLFPTIAEAQKNNTVLPIPQDDVPLFPVHVSDIIDCYLLTAAKLLKEPRDVAGKTFAVRGENPYTIREIIAAFEDVGGCPISVKQGDWPKPTREIKSIWRGRTLVGWQPKHSLSAGIQSVIGT